MILSINGRNPPCQPVSMTVKKSDLYSDSSKRSAETGRLLLYPVRMNIYSIDLEYLCTPEQAETLENLINGYNFPVEFLDNSQKTTANFYASDRTKTPEGTADSRKFRISFSLIQI